VSVEEREEEQGSMAKLNVFPFLYYASVVQIIFRKIHQMTEEYSIAPSKDCHL
jgi:hypothetical protein